MELSIEGRMTTPADTLYQRDIRGNKLPPEFPPTDTSESALAGGQTGRNVDFSI